MLKYQSISSRSSMLERDQRVIKQKRLEGMVAYIDAIVDESAEVKQIFYVHKCYLNEW